MDDEIFGWCLCFTIWDDFDEKEILVKEPLIGEKEDQAFVEALCLWRDEISNHHWYTNSRIVYGHQPQSVSYPCRPYIEFRQKIDI